MKQKDLEVLYIESETGHDTFMICRGVTRTYYVLAGSGSFTIDGRKYDVSPGVLVEVPSGVEYSCSGCMTMLAFCRQYWFRRPDKFTGWNRDVVGEEAPWSLIRRIFIGNPMELFRWLKAIATLKDVNMLIMTGTGMLEDYGIAPLGLRLSNTEVDSH